MYSRRAFYAAIAVGVTAVVAAFLIAVTLHHSSRPIANVGAMPGAVATGSAGLPSAVTAAIPAPDDSTGSSDAAGTATAAGAQPLSLWIGDSYTAGVGASSSGAGEACLTASSLGWECELDAQAGTGYVTGSTADAQPLIDRIAADQAKSPAPNYVLVDAGRYDGRVLTPTLQSAITTYFAKLAQTWPAASVVIIEPYFLSSPAGDFADVRKFIAGAATKYNWSVVDPVGSNWIGPSTAGASLVAADKTTPTAAGYQYIATHLAATLRPLAK